MHELNNEKLSLFIDGELEAEQSLRLLRTVGNDADLQDKLRRYALISQAIKGESCMTASPDFLNDVRLGLRDEPIHFIPNKKHGMDWKKTAWAAAASVLLGASVVSFIVAEKHSKPFGGAQVVAKLADQHKPDGNAKFKEYLQDHDNVWYVNNTVGAQPYVRVVGHGSR